MKDKEKFDENYILLNKITFLELEIQAYEMGIERLLNLFEFLKEHLDIDVDLENYNLNTCLGTISFIQNIDFDTMKKLKFLNEVLDC